MFDFVLRYSLCEIVIKHDLTDCHKHKKTLQLNIPVKQILKEIIGKE